MFSVLGQVDFVTLAGYGEIKIGTLKSKVEPLLEKLESVASYAWFAPLTFESAMISFELEGVLTQEDSLYVLEFMEEMTSYDGERFFYKPKNKEHKTFVGLRIAAIELNFDEQNLVSDIRIALDPKDVSEITKIQLITLLETELGESWRSMSIVSAEPPFPFYCTWDSSEQGFELIVSDMFEEGGDFGESVNIGFSKIRR